MGKSDPGLQTPLGGNGRTAGVGIHLVKQRGKPLRLPVSHGFDLTPRIILGNPFLQVDIGDDHGVGIKRPARLSS